jgi:hypothetical protein
MDCPPSARPLLAYDGGPGHPGLVPSHRAYRVPRGLNHRLLHLPRRDQRVLRLFNCTLSSKSGSELMWLNIHPTGHLGRRYLPP